MISDDQIISTHRVEIAIANNIEKIAKQLERLNDNLEKIVGSYTVRTTDGSLGKVNAIQVAIPVQDK